MLRIERAVRHCRAGHSSASSKDRAGGEWQHCPVSHSSWFVLVRSVGAGHAGAAAGQRSEHVPAVNGHPSQIQFLILRRSSKNSKDTSPGTRYHVGHQVRGSAKTRHLHSSKMQDIARFSDCVAMQSSTFTVHMLGTRSEAPQRPGICAAPKCRTLPDSLIVWPCSQAPLQYTCWAPGPRLRKDPASAQLQNAGHCQIL